MLLQYFYCSNATAGRLLQDKIQYSGFENVPTGTNSFQSPTNTFQPGVPSFQKKSTILRSWILRFTIIDHEMRHLSYELIIIVIITQDEWKQLKFRDCNGVSNGINLPISVLVLEEQLREDSRNISSISKIMHKSMDRRYF